MNNTIHVDGLRIECLGEEYVCDFDVDFDVLNPKDDIYNPDGSPAPDRGQDEVNFRQVKITASVLLGKKFSPIVESSVLAQLEEMCLDWCRDDGGMHMEAFKQFKCYK
jgi:hypothetical protein